MPEQVTDGAGRTWNIESGDEGGWVAIGDRCTVGPFDTAEEAADFARVQKSFRHRRHGHASSTEMVRDFHEAFDCAIDEADTTELRAQRAALILEEAFETVEALLGTDEALAQIGALVAQVLDRQFTRPKPLEDVAKELADTEYVVRGTALSFGIDHDEALALVHASNMSKLGTDGKPVYRESDGKVLKGPDYQPPTMDGVIARRRAD